MRLVRALAAMGKSEEELLAVARQSSKIQPHVLDFIQAPNKAKYVLELYDEFVVNNPQFPARTDVSYLVRNFD